MGDINGVANKELQFYCFNPEFAGLCGGKYYNIEDKGENKFSLRTLEYKESNEYPAILTPTILCVGRMMSGKTTYCMKAIVEGMIPCQTIFWIAGEQDQKQMTELSIAFEKVGKNLAYVHCDTPEKTHQAINTIENIYANGDSSSKEVQEKKCIVFDDIQEQLFNKSSAAYQTVLKVCSQWRHRGFTIVFLFQQFNYFANQKKLIDLMSHVIAFQMNVHVPFIDYFKRNSNIVSSMSHLSTQKKGG